MIQLTNEHEINSQINSALDILTSPDQITWSGVVKIAIEVYQLGLDSDSIVAAIAKRIDLRIQQIQYDLSVVNCFNLFKYIFSQMLNEDRWRYDCDDEALNLINDYTAAELEWFDRTIFNRLKEIYDRPEYSTTN